MTSRVDYKGSLRTVCTHLKSDSAFETDAPIDNNGKGERFSPTDLMATSLATCMLTVMGIKAGSLGFDIEGLSVEVEKIMLPNPRRVGGINLNFTIPEEMTSLNPTHIEALKHVAIHCPVQKSIHPDIAVSLNWGLWS